MVKLGMKKVKLNNALVTYRQKVSLTKAFGLHFTIEEM